AVTVHINYLLVLDEISRAENAYPHMTGAYATIQVQWKFPRQGWIKCNTDGALVSQNQQADCGGVFRNESGAWLGGFARKLGSCSALMAELWGILSALQLAKEKGYRKVILESDSTVAIDLIVKDYPDNHPCATIVSFINRLKMQEWE
ncbi:ribonuclease H protein, partial [Trifolium medium]|nr:ribonuclease H protein [Trifolium medium]